MHLSQSMDDLLKEGLSRFFSDIPFHNVLHLELQQADWEQVRLKLDMRPELVGNYIQGILHGGVISAALDAAGGCMAMIGTYARLKDASMEEKMAVLSKLGTIDMRVDFMRPGRGDAFEASAVLLRVGNKVAVTRMSFFNQNEELLAVGTGTYLCG